MHCKDHSTFFPGWRHYFLQGLLVWMQTLELCNGSESNLFHKEPYKLQFRRWCQKVSTTMMFIRVCACIQVAQTTRLSDNTFQDHHDDLGRQHVLLCFTADFWAKFMFPGHSQTNRFVRLSSSLWDHFHFRITFISVSLSCQMYLSTVCGGKGPC